MSTATLNISLPRELVKRTDAIARRQYKGRSDLIRDALRVYLDNEERWNILLREGKRFGRLRGRKSEQDVADLVSAYRHGA